MQEERFLGEILHRRAGVPMERLEQMYAIQREKGIGLTDLLVNGNVLDDAAIAKALAAEAELPFVETPEADRIPTALATRLPITFAKSHKVLVTNEDDFSVYVLVGDPFDTAAVDEITRPRELKTHVPQAPLEMPQGTRPASAGGTTTAPTPATGGTHTTPAPATPAGGATPPVNVNPAVRQIEKVEK